MRTIMSGVSLFLVTLTLVGCGQTGDLMLPNDPKDDRKAQYLLYKQEPKVQTAVEKTEEKSTVQQPVDTQTVSPAVSETK